jgi:acetyl-CoA carboxylase carboxyl transferase subunit alpha
MAAHYLDFERPIAEIAAKIEELDRLSETAGGDAFETELDALKTRVRELRREAYQNLDAWQKTQVARHPERPHFKHYVEALIEEYQELRGDRTFSDDQALIGGLGRFRGLPVVVMGHERGDDVATRIRHNFGMAHPEGYRKAQRLMDLAERFSMPVISFVDTGGAYPGVGGEERGQAEAIARSTERCLTLGVPMVCTITGEGGSGGALAIASGNKVMMLEHSVYAVASPEAAAGIIYRDRAHAPQTARSMKITAQELLELKVIDRIIPEPDGGAHADPAAAIAAVGDAVEDELQRLLDLTPDQLRQQRADRYLAIGRS